MEQILGTTTLGRMTATDLLAIGLGIALLAMGRRLYWLALGGVGFFAGLWLAGRFLHLPSSGLELGLGFLLAVLCAGLAIAAQKLAIGVAGFLFGGASALWLASWIDPGARLQPTLWLALAAAAGAVLGYIFASGLFEAALIAFSSVVGAYLVSSRSHLGPPYETWMFLILLLAGAIVQARRAGERERERKRKSDS